MVNHFYIALQPYQAIVNPGFEDASSNSWITDGWELIDTQNSKYGLRTAQTDRSPAATISQVTYLPKAKYILTFHAQITGDSPNLCSISVEGVISNFHS